MHSAVVMAQYDRLCTCCSLRSRALLTPGVTMIPACTCKLVACIDPYVFALSHPRFRYGMRVFISLRANRTTQMIHVGTRSLADPIWY